jgi:hypothetical protein
MAYLRGQQELDIPVDVPPSSVTPEQEHRSDGSINGLHWTGPTDVGPNRLPGETRNRLGQESSRDSGFGDTTRATIEPTTTTYLDHAHAHAAARQRALHRIA